MPVSDNAKTESSTSAADNDRIGHDDDDDDDDVNADVAVLVKKYKQSW